MPRKLKKGDTHGLCPKCEGSSKKKRKHVCNKYMCCLAICENCGVPYSRHSG